MAAEESAAGLRAFAVVPPSIDTALQAVLQSASADDVPLVERWRQRLEAGGVVPADRAAGAIVDVVLGDGPTGAVVDLTAVR